MYCKYNYVAGATVANILADIVAVLTGETVVANLSVACDDANSEILTTIAAAGWTVHDASAGTNAQVLKSAVADDAGFYKYLWLSSNTANYFIMQLYETWNATSHAGTNIATAHATANTGLANTSQQRVNTGAGGTMLIFASARFCAMQSTVAAGVGASNLNEWTGVFERSRLAPWDTTANAYPPAVILTGAAFGFMTGAKYACAASRIKNPAGGDYIGGTTANEVWMFPSTRGWGGEENIGAGATTIGIASKTTTVSATFQASIQGKIPDGSGGFYTPFTEIFVGRSHTTHSFEGGSISSACDVWSSLAYPNNLDTVVKGSNAYMFLQNTLYATNLTYTAASGQNSGNTVFPKG